MFDYLVHQCRQDRTIIFDLDNTLYSEEEFLISVYRRIASKYGNKLQDAVLDHLISNFREDGRYDVFGKMLRQFPNPMINVERCLEIMRSPITGRPFDLYPWVKKYAALIGHGSISIITNGNPQQQFYKIKYLNFNRFFSSINVAYANEYGKKPDPVSYYRLSDTVIMKDPIYVGDSYDDEVFANNCGIEFLDSKFIRVGN
jgi:FMN phosphatase YigB (HAD superfamily)